MFGIADCYGMEQETGVISHEEYVNDCVYMGLDQLIALATYSLIAGITPGPNNIYVTAVGVQKGFRSGIPYVIGVGVGVAVMFSVVGAGLGRAMLHHAAIYDGIRVLGIGVLIYLSYKIAKAGFSEESDSESNQSSDTRVEDRHIGVLGAAAFQWVNPKAWVAATGAISAFWNPEAPVITQSVVIALFNAGMGVISCSVWLLFGSLISTKLRSPGFRRLFNLSLAGLLLSCIWWIL